MRKAMVLAILLLPLWLEAQSANRVMWKVVFEVPYPCEIEEFDTVPIYVNGRKVTKQTQKILDYFSAEYYFEVKDGDDVEYRVQNPTHENFHYEIRDHLDRLMACRNPSSPFIGESPAPIKVRLEHGKVPGPAAFKIPIDGDTAYPLTGILEWSPHDNYSPYDCYDNSVYPQKLIRGYRLYWGKAGQEMELISEQSAALCWTMLERMDPDTEYRWKVVPFNEHGEAQGCPIWKYRTTLFSRVARFNDFGGVADFDGDGNLDFLYIENDFLDYIDNHYVIGYYRGYTGDFVVLVEGNQDIACQGAVWYDVDRDGDLDVVCVHWPHEFYCVDYEYDFQDCEEENLIVSVFLNKDGMIDDNPVTTKLKSTYLIGALHGSIRDSLPNVLKFADKHGNIGCFVAMDADGDGDADLLPAYSNSTPERDSIAVPLLPGHYYPHAYVSKHGEFEVLLNRQDEATSPKSYENELSASLRWGFGHHWADFDLDGDADLCYTYEYNYGIGLCDIFRNDSGKLVPLSQALSGYDALDPMSGAMSGSIFKLGSFYDDVYWYDIDGDSDLDLIHKNSNSSSEGDTYQLYLNQTIRNE